MKSIGKGLLILLGTILLFVSFPVVNAWYRAYPYTSITIEQVDSPYFIDLLVPRFATPVLDQAALEKALPSDYLVPLYVETMNGYRDADGYASLRLYAPSDGRSEKITDHTTEFVLDNRAQNQFKILLLFEDGTMKVSPAVTQRMEYSEVTYDLVTVGMQESNLTVPFQPMPYFPYPREINSNFLTRMLVIILFVIGIELGCLFIFGYRKPKSYVIVGLIRFNWLAFGALFFTLKSTVPLLILVLVFGLLFSIWIIAEAIFLPKWIGEKRMERTMTFAFSSNLITLLAVVLLSL